MNSEYNLAGIKVLPEPPLQRLDGMSLICWQVGLTDSVDSNNFSLVESNAANQDVAIRLRLTTNNMLEMLVSWQKELLPEIIWDQTYRALLLIEFYLCPIATIQGLPRSEWRDYFVVLESIGALEQDKPALIKAIQNGDKDEVVRILSKDDIEINLHSILDRTPLIAACLKGDIEIVKILILHGANINFGENEITPLQAAVTSRNYQLVNYLLDAGAEINLKNRYGETALWFAERWRVAKIAQLLIERGAMR